MSTQDDTGHGLAVSTIRPKTDPAARATQHYWPERTVGDLLAGNLVMMEELFGDATG